MTKKDIMAMTKCADVFSALKSHQDLLDVETGEHFNQLAKKEGKERLQQAGFEGQKVHVDYPLYTKEEFEKLKK